jgi:hypothetical protein
MAQVSGVLQTIEVDPAGSTSFKTLVCLRNSSVEGTNSVSEEETGCGKLTSVANPGFTFSADAICETAPTSGSQVSYKDLLTAWAANTLVNVRVQSPVVTGSSIGVAYYHQALCYITKLTLNQDAKGGAYISFAVTFQSTGVIDVTV